MSDEDTTTIYTINRTLFERVSSCACTLSANTSGRMVDSRRKQIASVIFGKIALHAYTMLQIAPSNSHDVHGYPFAFPDYASVFVLARAVMEGYCTLYYTAIDDISEDERNFRILLGDYHAKKKRVDLLKALGRPPAELPELEADADALRTALQQTDTTGIWDGKKLFLLSNTDICAKAGIAQRNYKPLYDYLSSYTHGYPISIEQILDISSINHVLNLLIPFWDVCSGYVCFAIRDFIRLFPDQNVFVDTIIQRTIIRFEENFRS